MATRYGPEVRGIESRCGAKFSAPVQNSYVAHTAPLFSWYQVSFPGVKRPGRGNDYPPSSNAEIKERVQLHLYCSSGPS